MGSDRYRYPREISIAGNSKLQVVVTRLKPCQMKTPKTTRTPASTARRIPDRTPAGRNIVSVSIRMCECVRKPTYAPTKVSQAKSSEANSSLQVTGLFRTYRSTTLEKTRTVIPPMISASKPPTIRSSTERMAVAFRTRGHKFDDVYLGLIRPGPPGRPETPRPRANPSPARRSASKRTDPG